MRPIDHRAIDPKQFSARPRRLRRDVRNRRERYDRFQKINHPSPEARVNTQSLHEILQQTDRKDLKIRFNLMHASVFLKQEMYWIPVTMNSFLLPLLLPLQKKKKKKKKNA